MERSFARPNPKPRRTRRQSRDMRPMLEGMEERVVLSLVAASPTDAKVNVTSPLDQTLPSVAMDANGDYVVAWSNQVHLDPNYLYDVEARVYNSAGQAQTGEIVVAQTTGDTRPSVAMDANGDFVVAYKVLNTTTYLYGISAQRFNLAGSPQGSTLVLNNGSSNSAAGELPKVAMDSAGDFVIAYQGYDSNSHGVFAQRYNSSGTAQGGTFRVNTPQNDNQGAPSIAMDSAGDFVIAWLDGGTTQAAGVYAQRYNSSGVAQGGNTAISTVAGASDPSVAMEPTGQYAIAWQFDQTGTATGIEAQRFDASGNALTSVVPLSSSETYEQGGATVAIDSEGDFVVAWESYGQGGTASSLATILAQRVNSGGTRIGPTQFLPSTQSGDNQSAPDVASNPNGNTIFVWQSKPSSTSDSQNVFSRLYDYVNDAPTINTPANLTINENAGQQTVNLTGITAGGGETQTLTVTASSNNTALVNPSVTYTSPNSTGTLTFTPAANSFGTATITVTVTDNGGTLNGGVSTTQVQFTVTVNQVNIPPTIDTPANLTINENAGQQTVNLTGITTGGGGTQTLTVTASSNNTALVNPSVTYTSPNSTGTLTFTPAANSFGTATITVTVKDNQGTTSVQFTVTVNQVAATVTAVSADWGTNGSVALLTASDGLRLLSAGRNTDLPWYGINRLQITLSQPETLTPGDVSVTGIAVANYGPVTISGSGTNYTITFAQAITTADRVTVTIGNAGLTTFTRRLDVLPGDVNDDGMVNSQDLVLVRNDFATSGALYNVVDDIDGDGVIDISDYNLVGRFVGKKLPAQALA
jgi:Bacterial Ig domain